jgi:hypothetical protein
MRLLRVATRTSIAPVPRIQRRTIHSRRFPDWARSESCPISGFPGLVRERHSVKRHSAAAAAGHDDFARFS